MTLPNSQRLKESSFKAFENKEKGIEMPNDLTRDELSFMAKRIKEVMRLTRQSNKNQESRKGKRTNKFSKKT